MSGFSASWLALREPYDRQARSRAVLDRLAALFAGRDSVTVADLGCGTGATMRAISSALPNLQRWRLIDSDETLLARAAASRIAGAQIETAPADLARDLESAIDADVDLVTVSALLDLVSAAWLDRLTATMARLARPLYAALSYNGDVAFAPAATHDATIIAAVNQHQLTDKGFGPALGPGAADVAPNGFRSRGFAVFEARSDWMFEPADASIQSETLSGWAAAATAAGTAPPLIARWLDERRSHIAHGRSRLRVGHIDFIAVPIERR